jgi:hypothetical protein
VEWQRAATRGARVPAEIDIGGTALARDRLAPVTAEDARQSLEIVLLDQEVRLRPSTFAGARRTADERGDVLRETAIAQRFHLGDRSGHRRNEGKAAQELFSVVGGHTALPAQYTGAAVRHLKFGVVLFGVVGLVGVFLPQTVAGHSISFWSTASNEGNVYLVVAAYALAALVGTVAVVAPPMQRWHSLVALVSFVFVLLKFRYVLPFHIFTEALGSKLLGIGAYGGALVSALSLLKPEPAD